MAIFALGFLDQPVLGAPGDLDPTFGTGGIALPPSALTVMLDLSLLADGRMLGVGYQDKVVALVRFQGDGSLDPSFGSGGVVTTYFTDGYDWAQSVAPMPDGKYLVGGTAGVFYPDAVTSGDFLLARYNPDGSLDPGFGDGGKVFTGFSPGGWDFSPDFVVQPDGKIVQAGAANYTQVPLAGFTLRPGDIGLARFNVDGTPDQSFGILGRVTTRWGVDGVGIAAVRLQPDGKIVVAGMTGYSSQPLSTSDFALARYNPDGTLDPSFGSGGMVQTDFLGWYDAANELAIQPDGKIVAVGFAGTDQPGLYWGFSMALARYQPDGSLDPNFGAGGRVITNFPGATLDAAYSIVLQPDGKIVVAGGGEPYDASNPDVFYVVRYLADGSLDPSFGSGGVVTTFGNDHPAIPVRVRLLDDGRILAAGNAGGCEYGCFALARYLGDSGVTGVPGTPLASAGLSLSLSPNPAAGSVAIVVRDADPASRLTVEIFDVNGRQVQGWSQLAGRDGARLFWDGTAANGRRVGSGIYVVRAAIPDAAVTKRIAITR